jgi:hypothetical protein
LELIRTKSKRLYNDAENLELSRWKPRVIRIGQDIPATGGPEMYDAGTPEQRLAEFLSIWKNPKPNFRAMADCVVLDSNDNSKEMPRRIREIYNSKHLMHFEFTDIRDTAPATTIIQAMLVYDERGARVDKSVQFIMTWIARRVPPTISPTGQIQVNVLAIFLINSN